MSNADLDARIALTGAVAHLMAARSSCTPETREALDVVLDRLAVLEPVESRTEWGVGDPDALGAVDEADHVREIDNPGLFSTTDRDFGRVLLTRSANLTAWTKAES